ncbi:phosphatidylglycerophosphate phosphatase PTPMT2-like [Zingiber officinale]|uniref:phosphatidylglycerophosphate phosphatase PTPMT2-like n=1 Tax=Zingiber officinale TaxID=94328 RepID=UPI001C4B15D8|nr:phosphatidylglycerophosphate phosphatase PTPMT2-like [Zingiber officinale]
MLIEEIGEECTEGGQEERSISTVFSGRDALFNAKRAAVGVGARILFYPTLVYNCVRNVTEPQFHWWDQVDECLLLGAVPFPSHVPLLKKLGVCGVITLTEPYETLVPTSLYDAHRIEHLLIPTRDYLFAPSFGDICLAVDFIHKNSKKGEMTYVHCKAGRGRSTTIVLCYLVQYKQMTPTAAYQYVKMRRPRVLLASAQKEAVEEFYQLRVQKTETSTHSTDLSVKSSWVVIPRNHISFDGSPFEIVSHSDLVGYNGYSNAGNEGPWTEPSSVYTVQIARRAVLSRLSYFWFRSRVHGCRSGMAHPRLLEL